MKIKSVPLEFNLDSIRKPLGPGIYSIGVGLLGEDAIHKGYTVSLIENFQEVIVLENEGISVSLESKDPHLIFISRWEKDKYLHYQLQGFYFSNTLISNFPLRSNPKFSKFALEYVTDDPILGSRSIKSLDFNLELAKNDYLTSSLIWKPYIDIANNIVGDRHDFK